MTGALSALTCIKKKPWCGLIGACGVNRTNTVIALETRISKYFVSKSGAISGIHKLYFAILASKRRFLYAVRLHLLVLT